MKELIHSITLLDINLIKYNFEVVNPEEASSGGTIDISCTVFFIENGDDKNKIELISKFAIRGFREDCDLFNLEEEFNAKFVKINPETFDKAPKNLQIEFCLSLIYPILRENALYTLSKAGLGQISIPFHFSEPDISQIK